MTFLIFTLSAIAIRIGANLQSGDLVCVVVDCHGEFALKDLAGPFHVTMANYAGQDEGCHHQVFKESSHHFPGFSNYSPFIIMIEVLSLIFFEKIVQFVPRLSQRLERFYKSVVEETLMGKDPDVAEDFAGNVISIEKILRLRQREEILGALKTSNWFYNCYLSKNVVQIVLGALYFYINMDYITHSSDNLGYCRIPLGINVNTNVTMQCKQKRFDVIWTLLFTFSSFIVIIIVLNLAALFWIWEKSGLRIITKIVRTLKESEKQILVKSNGMDFLFLFDMIAHNCGIPATLRVLTYIAPRFTEFCVPQIDMKDLKMTESTLSITWKPPPLQKVNGKQYHHLCLQKFVATIFPKKDGENYKDVFKNENYIAEFENLEGGTKEYLITVSAIISDAKMKGATIRTHLPPHPPQNLRVNTEASPDNEGSRLKVSWIKPKGDFDKFRLLICKLSPASSSNQDITMTDLDLSKDSVQYTIQNLYPGEAYEVQLQSVSGNQCCLARLTPVMTCLTLPNPPDENNTKVLYQEDEVVVYWQPHKNDNGHSFLEGYEVELKNASGIELVKDILNRHTFRYTFSDLAHGQEYIIGLTSICRLRDAENIIVHTEKSVQVHKNFMSLPCVPSNFHLVKSEPFALKLQWECPYLNTKDLNYAVSIEYLGETDDDKFKSEKIVAETSIQLSNLPHAGALYEIHLRTMMSYNSDILYSRVAKGLFVTKPCPPSELRVIHHENQEFAWKKSVTKSVQKYKFKIKGEDKSQDFLIPSVEEEEYVTFQLPIDLEEGVDYNINLYSQVFSNDVWHESYPLFLKLLKTTDSSPYSSAVDFDEMDGGLIKHPFPKLILSSPKSSKTAEKSNEHMELSSSKSNVKRQSSIIK